MGSNGSVDGEDGSSRGVDTAVVVVAFSVGDPKSILLSGSSNKRLGVDARSELKDAVERQHGDKRWIQRNLHCRGRFNNASSYAGGCSVGGAPLGLKTVQSASLKVFP